ncbi:hypothetical protein M0805_006814 [Coniferiporia weirii]|nr:hypothetical protein M0805_006814 [Coniferiporia weirii]
MSANIDDITGKEFDFVVIGLTVAARLAEDPNVTVCVLEAGSVRLDDPLIYTPAEYGKQEQDPRYDWDFLTVPQVNSNGRTFHWPRGKLLGGSSGINFQVWTLPPKEDINNWEKLGNPGWNWDRYLTHVMKAEGFIPPKESDAVANRQTYNPAVHGTTGPVRTTLPSPIMQEEVPFQDTLINAGIKVAKDPDGGDPIGSTMLPSTIDANSYTRSYAATAYFVPNAGLPNLKVLCDSLVHRITLKKGGDGQPLLPAEAEGVEFEYNNTVYTVFARKEVVLSAGALKSPQVLELSGIGDSKVLGPLGIRTIIDLPGVGSNMQEHILGSVVFELDPKLKYRTFDTQGNDSSIGDDFNRICLSGYTYVPLPSVTSDQVAKNLVAAQRQSVEERIKAGTVSDSLAKQWLIQLDVFEQQTGADVEIIFFGGYFGGAPKEFTEAGRTFVSVVYGANHLFSRGTIHAVSTDPHDQPIIDPHYFDEKLDLDVMTETVKFIRTLRNVAPFKDVLIGEINPGPACTTDVQIKDFIKNDISTICHTASTLSMLPQELDGVVDPNLLVYGTNNIRVIDLSIVPLHISAHCQSTVYSIGEQGAEIIKAKWGTK